MTVAAVTAERRDLVRSVTVAGTVEPVRTIGVNSQMAGTVVALHVAEGDRVRRGRLLAELDAREVRAQLERARAVLANAEAAYRRSRELAEARIVSEAEYDAARSAYEVAKADAELWATRLEFSQIRAPADGVVTAKYVEAGTAVAANQRLFDIADLALLVIRVPLSELDVVHARVGDPVDVRLDAYPNALLRGRVRRVFPSADPQSRLVTVEVALDPPPPGAEPRPGFLARVRFRLERRDGVVAVPASAVAVAERTPYVYVIEGDTLVRRRIEPGLAAEGWVEVVDGLRAGERVVLGGHASLRPGMRVRASDRPTPAEVTS